MLNTFLIFLKKKKKMWDYKINKESLNFSTLHKVNKSTPFIQFVHFWAIPLHTFRGYSTTLPSLTRDSNHNVHKSFSFIHYCRS